MTAEQIVEHIERLRVASARLEERAAFVEMARSLDRGVRVRAMCGLRDDDVSLEDIFAEADRQGIIGMLGGAYPVEVLNWRTQQLVDSGEITAEQADRLRI